MSRVELECVRADVERLNRAAGALQACQVRANNALQAAEDGGEFERSNISLVAMQLFLAAKTCRGFSEYFEKRTGVSLSEEKEERRPE